MLHKSKLFLKRNSSTILTCLGAAGVITTTIMAVKATPKALVLLEEAEREKEERLTKLETAVVAAPVYIPTALVGVSTIACLFGANMLNKRQQAALTSAYALLHTSYKEYKDKVLEVLGEEGNAEIQSEIAKDNYKGADVGVTEGKELFYDAYSGRYFESTKYDVKEAQYQLNRDLIMRDYIYLNEWYDYLGLERVDGGWDSGWCGSVCYEAYWQMWLDFSSQKTVLEDGRECTIIDFWQAPLLVKDFEEYF